MREQRLAATILFLLWLLLLGGCGRKTAVRPPELVAPQTIMDLSAQNAAEGIRLRWSRPLKRVDGSDLEDLAGFMVLREVTAAQSEAFQPIATVKVEDRDRFRKAKRFSYLDSEVDSGVLYRYQVLAFTLDGDYSTASNTVEATWKGGP